ncbi:Uncharacterised protein [Vibrio cholerae]|nr:Uncharacterised protein [Vibrio cholerae]
MLLSCFSYRVVAYWLTIILERVFTNFYVAPSQSI